MVCVLFIETSEILPTLNAYNRWRPISKMKPVEHQEYESIWMHGRLFSYSFLFLVQQNKFEKLLILKPILPDFLWQTYSPIRLKWGRSFKIQIELGRYPENVVILLVIDDTSTLVINCIEMAFSICLSVCFLLARGYTNSKLFHIPSTSRAHPGGIALTWEIKSGDGLKGVLIYFVISVYCFSLLQ